ncbi:hypothetical protein RIF29_20611 [Crotalaria pallida]|uniref:Uncharacterized protein n=1 Tax=Crotalaria pallida TaxID=3830 RepID=A0AAN9F5Y0_CROPI
MAGMAMHKALFRPSSLRQFSTSAKPSHHNNHHDNHKYLEPNSFLGSWQAPRNPKEAEARLALLRREYVKEVRKEYVREMELMALEKQRKDKARREALRVANEERRKLKAEAAKVRAQERQIAQQQFHETLLKERAAKLECWRMQIQKHSEKKTEKKELLRKQSSIWIDEADLEKKILNVAAALAAVNLVVPQPDVSNQVTHAESDDNKIQGVVKEKEVQDISPAPSMVPQALEEIGEQWTPVKTRGKVTRRGIKEGENSKAHLSNG